MPTLSVPIPDDISSRLDMAAKITQKSRLEKLRALKGAGARLYGSLNAEEIDADIHEFRGDE